MKIKQNFYDVYVYRMKVEAYIIQKWKFSSE
jgi:hypothetical protein